MGSAFSPRGLDMLNPQEEVHGAGEVGPFLSQGEPLLATEGGQAVMLSLAAFGRERPFGFEETALFQAVKGRIERSFLGEQPAAASLLDRAGDVATVGRAAG